jgi:hypothetical protein
MPHRLSLPVQVCNTWWGSQAVAPSKGLLGQQAATAVPETATGPWPPLVIAAAGQSLEPARGIKMWSSVAIMTSDKEAGCALQL